MADEHETDLPFHPKDWKEFEKLVAKLHYTPGALVQHDATVQGRSGAEYQVDCAITYPAGPYSLTVLVSCKDWKKKVDRPPVTTWFATIEDCRANKGVVVSARGFTKEAIEYARDKNIELFHLKPMTPEEWAKEGGIQAVEVGINLIGFNLTGGTLVLKGQNIDGVHPTRLHQPDADLFDSTGRVIGNAIDLINREVPPRIAPTDDIQHAVIVFPDDAHIRINSQLIPAKQFDVSFTRFVIRQSVHIKLPDIIKAVFENIHTGQRHRVTRENELLISPNRTT